MSRKNILPYKLSAATSLAANFISPVTRIPYMDNCSYQINITTINSTGTFSIQGSDDYETSGPTEVVVNPGHWTDLPLSGTPAAGGTNDTILIDMNQVPFNAMRVVYTSTVAGTGTCDIYVFNKMIGG